MLYFTMYIKTFHFNNMHFMNWVNFHRVELTFLECRAGIGVEY